MQGTKLLQICSRFTCEALGNGRFTSETAIWLDPEVVKNIRCDF
jgi:hypothetical protein